MKKEMSEHPPIYCHRCGKRIKDAGELALEGIAVKRGDPVCRCPYQMTTICSSSEQPIDLQWYDKHLK